MRISRLTIDGFRGVHTADLRFGKHTVLVGPNNVGKTTIIETLALLFGRDKLVRTLTEHDFFGSAPSEKSRILVVATVTDFEEDDPGQHREWFSADRGVEKWLNAQTDRLNPFRDSGSWKLAVQVGFAARFNVDTLDVETTRFYVDDDSDVGDPFDEETHIRTIRGKTLQELGFFLVSATRTWDRWISFSSELFRKVIAVTGGVPANAVRTERERLWNPEQRLENADGVLGIVRNINDELSHLISVSPKLQLRLTSTDSEGVLQAIVPHFQGGKGPTLPSSRQGSGLASLQSLLLLMQFGAARRAKSQCFVLAVEEPELHVAPSQQKRLVNRLNAVCTQTLMTTHSPVVASMFPPEDVLFLRNLDGVLTGSPLSVGTIAPSNHAQHLFYAWRDRLVAALMHEFVLIPEGVSDVVWLDALETAIELRQEWTSITYEPTRFGTFVGIAPTTDAKIADTYTIASGVHSGVFCLVDGDSPGLGYLKEVKELPTPPRIVVVWPEGWTMEHVVLWLAAADSARSMPALQTALASSFTDGPALVSHLLAHKSYVPVPNATAEVLAGIPKCRARVTELLNDIADVARQAEGEKKHLVRWLDQSSDRTQVWRLQT